MVRRNNNVIKNYRIVGTILLDYNNIDIIDEKYNYKTYKANKPITMDTNESMLEQSQRKLAEKYVSRALPQRILDEMFNRTQISG